MTADLARWLWEEHQRSSLPVPPIVQKVIRAVTKACLLYTSIDGLAQEAARETLAKVERHGHAEALIGASGARIDHEDGDRAYYAPVPDRIVLPQRTQFQSSDGYYATALHELGHWTGHTSRLARDLSNPFGSEGYALSLIHI